MTSPLFGLRRALPRSSRYAFLGWSRHSVLPAVRDLHAPTRSLGKTVLSLVAGCTLIGVSVTMMVKADLGLSPYDTFSEAIGNKTGLTIGQAGWLIAGALFLVAGLLGHRPTVWSVLYVVGNGVAIDATAELINGPSSMAGRALLAGSAIPIMAFGIMFVLHSGVTGGAFELLMNAGAERGIDPTWIRYGLDIGVLLGGIVLGGPLGVATVVFAATMGAMCRWMQLALADHRSGRAARLLGEAAVDCERVPVQV